MGEQTTVGEYAREIGAEVREAFASQDRAKALGAISRARRDLAASDLSQTTKSTFWKLAEEEFNNGRLLRKADNAAFIQLLREIEAALQAGQNE